MTKEQFDAEIEKGMADIQEGRVYSAEAVESEIQYSCFGGSSGRSDGEVNQGT